MAFCKAFYVETIAFFCIKIGQFYFIIRLVVNIFVKI